MANQGRGQAVRGPLAPHASGFAGELRSRGYSPSAVRLRLWLFDHLSRWLEAHDLAPADLTEERVDQFLGDRRAAGYKSWVSTRSISLPLDYLRVVGVAPPRSPAGPEDTVLVAYRQYLLEERGLTARTADAYVVDARLFVSALGGREGVDLGQLGTPEVLGFVKGECARRRVASAQHLLVSLRSFLRYLHVSGIIGAPLAAAVPAIARRRESVPRGIDADSVARLLASCDRHRSVGLRDYSILLLLARLGLRRGEVAALRLEDLDWRQGEMLVRGKGDRHEKMPLPVDVGRALSDYLRHGRPLCDERRVFLRVRAPQGALAPSGVSAVVHDACVRAGLPPVRAHRLRHTAATAMLNAGSPLPEVAAVLRHHRLASSSIYAKVDRQSLVSLARPWPGGAS